MEYVHKPLESGFSNPARVAILVLEFAAFLIAPVGCGAESKSGWPSSGAPAITSPTLPPPPGRPVPPGLDTTAPSTPTGLAAVAAGTSVANLTWTASTDNVGVMSYIVRRDGVEVANPLTTNYSDSSLSAGNTYSYAVAARDAAGNISPDSAGASATTAATPTQSIPTVTFNVVTESSAGHDGNIAWQSVFLLTDGRIASFGTGNHAPEQANSMRIIDPVTTPGTVKYLELFPWTQDISPPDMATGRDRYVSNYDNHASIYIPSDNKVIWLNHGVFDFAKGTWIYGDRAPLTSGWDAYLNDPTGSMYGAFNPSVAWCVQIDVGVWFGNSAGGFGRNPNDLTLVQRSAAGASKPWMLSVTNMASEGVLGLAYARNTAVCIGEYLYVGGPSASGGGNLFYKIHVPTKKRAATLTPYPAVPGEYFPQMVYDSKRGRIVVFGLKVFLFDINANSWSDVTPGNWPGYESAMGVYHPALDAILFRGKPSGSTALGPSFQWNKMVFTD